MAIDRRVVSAHEGQQDGAAPRSTTLTANALARAIGRTVEWLSATTGQHPGRITAEVSQWHDDLQRAGLADQAAQQAIVEICNTARDAGQNIRDVRGAVAARVAHLEAAA